MRAVWSNSVCRFSSMGLQGFNALGFTRVCMQIRVVRPEGFRGRAIFFDSVFWGF